MIIDWESSVATRAREDWQNALATAINDTHAEFYKESVLQVYHRFDGDIYAMFMMAEILLNRFAEQLDVPTNYFEHFQQQHFERANIGTDTDRSGDASSSVAEAGVELTASDDDDFWSLQNELAPLSLSENPPSESNLVHKFNKFFQKFLTVPLPLSRTNRP